MGLFGFNQIPIRFGLSVATLSLLKKFPNHLPYRWFWGRIWHFFCLRITKPYSTTRLLKDLSLHSLISLRLFSASVDFPIQAGLLLHDLPIVFAAARQVDIEREYIPSRDQYVLRFRGMDQPVQVLSTLYQNAISSSTLGKLGRPVTVFTQPGFVHLIFGNAQPVATCSPKAFGKAVAIAAVRLLLNTLVKKNWFQWRYSYRHQMTWEGTLVRLHSQQYQDDCADFFCCHWNYPDWRQLPSQICFTSDEWRLGDYPCSAKGRIPLGGGPSKNSQKITHKNAIAGALIQHGYDMRWVSTTVESLIHKLISHSETPIYFGYAYERQ